MVIEVKEQWVHEGELCIRGTAYGETFSAVFIPTDIDYGWRALNYLPTYQDEADWTEEQDEFLEELLWEELDHRLLVIELFKSYSY